MGRALGWVPRSLVAFASGVRTLWRGRTVQGWTKAKRKAIASNPGFRHWISAARRSGWDWAFCDKRLEGERNVADPTTWDDLASRLASTGATETEYWQVCCALRLCGPDATLPPYVVELEHFENRDTFWERQARFGLTGQGYERFLNRLRINNRSEYLKHLSMFSVGRPGEPCWATFSQRSGELIADELARDPGVINSVLVLLRPSGWPMMWMNYEEAAAPRKKVPTAIDAGTHGGFVSSPARSPYGRSGARHRLYPNGAPEVVHEHCIPERSMRDQQYLGIT